MQTAVFGGRVLVDVGSPGTMRGMIVLDGLQRAVPEHKTWAADSISTILFWNLTQYLGRTRGIVFAPDETDPTILAWREYWELCKSSTDYSLLWQTFIDLKPAINEEWGTATNAEEDARLKAPDVVQPGAPSDDQLREAGDEGKKNLRNATPTSQPLTKKQKRSSTAANEVASPS